MAILKPGQLASGSYTISGSFSGSFQGSGAGLNNIPSSAIVGLSSTQIASGNVTASVSTGTGSFTVTSGSSTFMFVSSSGNVGFGTSSPTAKIHIVGVGTTNATESQRIVNGSGAVIFLAQDNLDVRIGKDIAAFQRAYSLASGASFPAYSFSGNSGTGLYQDGANTVGISTGNTSRLQIASTGNVLINTTSDSGFKLDVNGIFRLGSSGARMFADTLNTLSLNFGNTSSTFGSETIYLRTNTGGIIELQSSYISRLRVAPTTGNILINTTTDTGHKLLVSGSSASGSVNLDNTLYVSGSRVGIGTSTPISFFDVVSTSGFPKTFISFRRPTVGDWGLSLGSETISNLYIGAVDVPGTVTSRYFWRANYNTAGVAANTFRPIDAALTTVPVVEIQGVSSTSANYFSITSAGASMGDILGVKSTGNVLINSTTDAGYKLDVNGTARVQDTLTLKATDGTALTAFGGTVTITQSGGARYLNFLNGGISFNSTYVFTISNGSNVPFAASGTDVYISHQNTNGLFLQRNSGYNYTINKLQGGSDLVNNLDIRTADYTISAYGPVSSGNIRLYSGDNTGTGGGGFGNIILQHNGTVKRGNVLIGTSTNVASAIVNVESTTQGFLPPRMTLAQRVAISSPASGLIVYETGSATTEGLWLNETTGWHQLLTNSGSQSISGSLNVTSITTSDATISGNVTVSGTASINTLIVNQIGYSSGSNQLGDAVDDTQTLYGTVRIPTGSLTVTGSLNVSSSATIQTLTVGLGAGSIAFNTALGFQALRVNTTGEANVGVGYQTFYNNTSGGYGVAVGYQSLYNNLGGNNNSAIGWFSLYNNTNGSGNTAIGLSSLQSNTIGNSNTALGRQSLFLNTTGSNITAIGHSSLRSNLANNNTALGFESAFSNTTGAQITAVGNSALRSNTLGSNNGAFGDGALYFNTTGNNNVSLGAYSLFRNISGSNNTSVGDTSLGFTTSNNNVALGYLAGNSNTSGANNIFIGANSTGVSATDSNRTWIGNSSTTSTWLAGNVLINTTTDAGFRLDVNGTARVQGNLFEVTNGTNKIAITSTQISCLAGVSVSDLNIVAGPISAPNSILGIGTTVGGGSTTILRLGAGNATNASGIVTIIESLRGFAPTSGTATFSFATWNGTINQTGGANGITRGLYINPTLTSAADFRAIETTTGSVLFNGGTKDSCV